MRGPPPRIVPWTSLQEWAFVRDGLFSPKDPDMQIFALEIIRVWLTKGRVPTAVEASANLIQVARLDRQLSSHSDNVDSCILRLAYAAAITRFVNEIVDPRQGGVGALPIARLAEQVGLPRILVDLRHESVHDTLPSLEVFRYALDEALNWLWKSYWVPQSEHDEMLSARIAFTLQRTAAALAVAVKEYQEKDGGEGVPPNLAKLASKNMCEIEYLYSSSQVISTLCDLLFSDQFIDDSCLYMALCEMYSENGPELFATFLTESMLKRPLLDRVLSVALDGLLIVLSHSSLAAENALMAAMGVLVMNPSDRMIGLCDRIFGCRKLDNQKLIDLFMSIRTSLSQNTPVTLLGTIKTIEDVKQTANTAQRKPPPTKWTLAPNWRPCPLGCTPDYNPSHDYMSLWQQ